MVIEYTEEQLQLSMQLPMQPPRPPNCFMIWAQEKRKEIAQNNMIKNNTDTSIMLGKIWSSMSDKFKLRYKDKANILKYEHRLKYPNYKYKPKKKEIKIKENIKENIKGNNKENVIKIRKIKQYTKKEKLINKNKIKEIVLNNFEEPDYFNQIQMFYDDLDEDGD